MCLRKVCEDSVANLLIFIIYNNSNNMKFRIFIILNLIAEEIICFGVKPFGQLVIISIIDQEDSVTSLVLALSLYHKPTILYPLAEAVLELQTVGAWRCVLERHHCMLLLDISGHLVTVYMGRCYRLRCTLDLTQLWHKLESVWFTLISALCSNLHCTVTQRSQTELLQ